MMHLKDLELTIGREMAFGHITDDNVKVLKNHYVPNTARNLLSMKRV
jgi:hypothetical protein